VSNEIQKNLESFPKRLREARKALHLGQKELADKLGVSSGAVGNWEVGPTIPHPETLGKLAEILGVKPGWLLYEDQPTNRVEPQKEVGPMYRVIGESFGTEDEPTRERCREYFEKFMATCDTRSRLGWLLEELRHNFPLNKFKKETEK
jgi:transcriptional regulator with XRE-family HTH domain